MKATQYFKLISNQILLKSIKWNAVFAPLFPFLSPPVPAYPFFSDFRLLLQLPVSYQHLNFIIFCPIMQPSCICSIFKRNIQSFLLSQIENYGGFFFIFFRIENKTNVTHSLWIETGEKKLIGYHVVHLNPCHGFWVAI